MHGPWIHLAVLGEFLVSFLVELDTVDAGRVHFFSVNLLDNTRVDLTLPQYLTLPQLRVFLGEPYLSTDARKPEARET